MEGLHNATKEAESQVMKHRMLHKQKDVYFFFAPSCYTTLKCSTDWSKAFRDALCKNQQPTKHPNND